MRDYNFACGHRRTPGNISGRITPRCKTCENTQRARRKGKVKGGSQLQYAPPKAGSSAKLYTDAARQDEGILGFDSWLTSLPEGSQALLEAIYRAHPYVFDAAERAGRRVVRP
jgi:hypothetical protein